MPVIVVLKVLINQDYSSSLALTDMVFHLCGAWNTLSQWPAHLLSSDLPWSVWSHRSVPNGLYMDSGPGSSVFSFQVILGAVPPSPSFAVALGSDCLLAKQELQRLVCDLMEATPS